MRVRDAIDLILLAALWGGSFLFTRMAVHEFGPIPLIELRTGIAALFLLPLLACAADCGTSLATPARSCWSARSTPRCPSLCSRTRCCR